MEQEDFLNFMRHTLALDLKDEGRVETSKDIIRLCELFRHLENQLKRIQSNLYHAQQEANEYKRISDWILKDLSK